MSYPAEPWHLRGQLHLSVWSVPLARLPRLPDGFAAAVRPVTVGGRGLVGAAWVEYEPGGVLRYRELLSAVLVRDGARLRVSVTDIWVDSEISRDGGRELWGIPKQLADLDFEPDAGGGPAGAADRLTAQARTAAGVIAQATISAGPRYPGRWPARLSVVQELAGRVKVTPVRGRAGLQHAKAIWSVPPSGPLAYLSGRRPLLTVTLRDFRLVFGRSPAPRGQARRRGV
jgi:hypothetical protein